VTRLRGADIDPVAVRITQMSLLLNALPAGNGWLIEQADLLKGRPTGGAAVVLANPPWAYNNTGSQTDLADTMLARIAALVSPRGILGVVLPEGWLSRRSAGSRLSRNELAERFDVQEIWRLPPGTFSDASSGAAVLIARRKSPGSNFGKWLVQRRVLKRDDLAAFYSSGVSQQLMLPRPDGRSDALAVGGVSNWVRGREFSHSVGSYVMGVVGPQPASKAASMFVGIQIERNARFVRWEHVAPYAELHSADARSIAFPEEMQNGSRRGESLLGRKKAVVSCENAPSRVWRLKVAIDTDGSYMFPNSAMGLLWKGESATGLSEDDCLYAIMAYLGSGFCNALIDETVAVRYISRKAIESLPAPPIAIMSELAAFGRIASSAPDKATQATALLAVEALVWRWLRLPAGLLAAVQAALAGAAAPEGRLRYELLTSTMGDGPRRASEELPAERAAAVIAVEADRVRIAVTGRTPEDGEWSALPYQLPGALLDEGATLIALDDGSPLAWLDYRFEPNSHLSFDTILDDLLGQDRHDSLGDRSG
jgi:hypothetical protein